MNKLDQKKLVQQYFSVRAKALWRLITAYDVYDFTETRMDLDKAEAIAKDIRFESMPRWFKLKTIFYLIRTFIKFK